MEGLYLGSKLRETCMNRSGAADLKPDLFLTLLKAVAQKYLRYLRGCLLAYRSPNKRETHALTLCGLCFQWTVIVTTKEFR